MEKLFAAGGGILESFHYFRPAPLSQGLRTRAQAACSNAATGMAGKWVGSIPRNPPSGPPHTGECMRRRKDAGGGAGPLGNPPRGFGLAVTSASHVPLGHVRLRVPIPPWGEDERGCPGFDRLVGCSLGTTPPPSPRMCVESATLADIIRGLMISISIFGIGDWGYNHLRTFSTLGDVKVEMVCDLNDKLLDRARKQFPAIAVTKNPAEAIERAEAVVIASSAKTHFELTKLALLAGRHVLVEKPMALKVAEGRALVELAQKQQRILMVGHLLLHHPAVLLAKELINAGEIGTPLYLYTQRVNLGKIRSDENAIWSLAPHDVSMANFIFDASPVRVSARGHAYVQPGIEDVAFVTMEYPNGRLAHTHVSWLDPHKVRKLTVVGDKKMLVFDDMESEEKLKIYDKSAGSAGDAAASGVSVRYGDIRSPRTDPKEPLRQEAEHFIDCVRTGKPPRTDGRQGLDVLKVLEATNRSLASGGKPVETLENS
jgi:predicted dehydrogenase